MIAPLFFAEAGPLDVDGTFIVESIAFIAMLLILGKWAYPKIMAAADERNLQIEAGLRAAEESEKRLAEVKIEADQLLAEARNQAREIVVRAERDATSVAEEIRTQGKDDAKALRDQAVADAHTERERITEELRAQMGTLVALAASQVLGRVLDSTTHKQLIQESLQRVSAEREGQA